MGKQFNSLSKSIAYYQKCEYQQGINRERQANETKINTLID